MFFGEDFGPIDAEDWFDQTAAQSNRGNLLIDFGSNMAVLTHPDVKGITVRRDPSGGLEIEVFAYRVTPSLRLLIREEFGDHFVRFMDASLGPDVPEPIV